MNTIAVLAVFCITLFSIISDHKGEDSEFAKQIGQGKRGRRPSRGCHAKRARAYPSLSGILGSIRRHHPVYGYSRINYVQECAGGGWGMARRQGTPRAALGVAALAVINLAHISFVPGS